MSSRSASAGSVVRPSEPIQTGEGNRITLLIAAEFMSCAEKLEETAVEVMSGPCELLRPAGDGRGIVRRVELADGRALVVRRFLRGGWMRIFSSGSYVRPLSRGQLRPMVEFRITEELAARGLSVPVPVCAAVRWSPSRLFYGGLLATEEIEGAVTLLSIAHRGTVAPEELERLSYEGGKVAREVGQAGILHCDLHLGNILVRSDAVYLIDFDRAIRTPFSEQAIRRVLARWKRSTEKHRLTALNAPFERGLRGGR